jgi:DNA-binding protein
MLSNCIFRKRLLRRATIFLFKYFKQRLAIKASGSAKSRNVAQYTKSIYLYSKVMAMKNLSLKMDEDVFLETEKITEKISKSRNRYINEAVEFYNLLQRRRILSDQLQKESKKVQEESLKVLAEFEKLQDED